MIINANAPGVYLTPPVQPRDGQLWLDGNTSKIFCNGVWHDINGSISIDLALKAVDSIAAVFLSKSTDKKRITTINAQLPQKQEVPRSFNEDNITTTKGILK